MTREAFPIPRPYFNGNQVTYPWGYELRINLVVGIQNILAFAFYYVAAIEVVVPIVTPCSVWVGGLPDKIQQLPGHQQHFTGRMSSEPFYSYLLIAETDLGMNW